MGYHGVIGDSVCRLKLKLMGGGGKSVVIQWDLMVI